MYHNPSIHRNTARSCWDCGSAITQDSRRRQTKPTWNTPFAIHPLMSPRPTTIVLNSELNHSIRYDPSDDSVTALLPRPITIEHVRNKAKLMLLIYFVQRDQQRKSSPRKIDADVSVELRIVERIINQFSNYAQALRTLTEYTVLGDTVDTRTGLANTRDRSDPSKTIAITMTVTPEIKQTIKEWLRDILGGQVSYLTKTEFNAA